MKQNNNSKIPDGFSRGQTHQSKLIIQKKHSQTKPLIIFNNQKRNPKSYLTTQIIEQNKKLTVCRFFFLIMLVFFLLVLKVFFFFFIIFFNIVPMWKIVGALEVSVLYIYRLQKCNIIVWCNITANQMPP